MTPMLARLVLLASLAVPSLASAATPSVLRFDAGQLQAAARATFPVEESLLEGFASLTLSDPDVRIPTPGERLQLLMKYDIALATGERLEYGDVAVSSGLRYDPATRGLHLVDPQLEHVGTSAGGRGLPGSARDVLQDLIREYARTRPLYRLSADDLAQVPGTLTAESLRIRDGHVELRLPVDAAR